MAKSLQHQIVARALDIISDEERWTCLAVARTANGSHCDCRDVAATRFCAVGALYRGSDELLGEEAFSSCSELRSSSCARTTGPMTVFLASTTGKANAVIIAMFRRALAS